MPRRSTRKKGGGKGKKERGKGQANLRNESRRQHNMMNTLVHIQKRVMAKEPRPANLPKNQMMVWKMSEKEAFPNEYVPTCDYCNATTHAIGSKLLHCGRCWNSLYCSKEHQKADWPEHKKYCIPRTNPATASSSNAQ